MLLRYLPLLVGGGIKIERTHPAKYLWDQMPESHTYLRDIFPKELCLGNADPAATSPSEEGVAIPGVEVDPNDDLTDAPFPVLPDVLPTEEAEVRSDLPESVTEIEIIRRLLAVDFTRESWQDYESTHWQMFPAYYIVYKANSVINMPAVNGKSGAPHPCMVTNRWTLAWSQTKVRNAVTGILERPSEMMIIADNYHLPAACRSPAQRSAFGKLRSQWNGVQIYLKGGVRLVSPLYDALTLVPDAIKIAIADSGRTVRYIKDVAASPPPAEDGAETIPPAISPGGGVPASSVAHSMLQYGAITESTFYEQLRAARRLRSRTDTVSKAK